MSEYCRMCITCLFNRRHLVSGHRSAILQYFAPASLEAHWKKYCGNTSATKVTPSNLSCLVDVKLRPLSTCRELVCFGLHDGKSTATERCILRSSRVPPLWCRSPTLHPGSQGSQAPEILGSVKKERKGTKKEKCQVSKSGNNLHQCKKHRQWIFARDFFFLVCLLVIGGGLSLVEIIRLFMVNKTNK